MRQQQQQQQPTETSCINNTSRDYNGRSEILADHRDDNEDNRIAPVKSTSGANTGAVLQTSSRTIPTSQLRSISPPPEYAASAPYYDVLLYTYIPEKMTEKNITNKKMNPIMNRVKMINTITDPKKTATEKRNCDSDSKRDCAQEIHDKVPDTQYSKCTTYIRKTIEQLGTTSLEVNDRDKMGDGDQSPIVDSTTHEFYLELFNSGGDFDDHILKSSKSGRGESAATSTTKATYQTALSTFADHCVAGPYGKVKQILDKNSIHNGKSWNTIIRLLETRETVLHMSPLLLVFCMIRKIGIVIAGNQRKMRVDSKTSNNRKNQEDTEDWMKYIDELEQNLVKVVIELLYYGASPKAKDLCGRTVCFYGASKYATPRSLHATTMCINAAISTHYFCQEVVIHGLDHSPTETNDSKKNGSRKSDTELRNGMRGVTGGYQADTGRRIVYLFGRKSEVALLNRNIGLVQNDPSEASSTRRDVDTVYNLCNVQDRLGHVCLTELLGTKRKDVMSYLLTKHRASIDIPNWSGLTLRQHAFATTYSPIYKSAVLINDEITTALEIVNYAMKTARNELNEINSMCSECKSTAARDSSRNLHMCQRCMSARYCSEKCQVRHWRDGGHKMECVKLRKMYKEYITLDETSIANTTSQLDKVASFRKPSNVEYDHPFTVKVESLDHLTDTEVSILHIYDKSLKCDFKVKANQKLDAGKSIMKLAEKVKEDTVTTGKAIYLEASFDSTGKFTVFINRKKMRIW